MSHQNPQQGELQEQHTLVFAIVCDGVAKAISRSFPLLFQEFCVLRQLMPVISMHRSKMSHQILFSLEVLLAGQARLRQQPPDVVIKEKVFNSIRFNCLHDQTVSSELLCGELGSVLECSMILSHVLFQSMLRQIHLTALVTSEGDLRGQGELRCRLSHTGHVHGILSEHNAFVNPFGDDSAECAG